MGAEKTALSRVVFLCFVLWAILCLQPTCFNVRNVHAEDWPVVVATNADVTGRVLRLNFAEEGNRFVVVWVAAGGKKYQKTHFTRKGEHAYEMRDNPQWRGPVSAIGLLNVTEARGTLVDPAGLDEWDMFLSPELLAPSTVNALYGHAIFGYRFESLGIMVAIISVLLIKTLFRKSFPAAIVMGFVAALSIMEVRNIHDRFSAISRVDCNEYLKRFKFYTEATRKAGQRIGDDHTWSQRGVSWPMTVILSYGLAEKSVMLSDSNKDASVNRTGVSSL